MPISFKTHEEENAVIMIVQLSDFHYGTDESNIEEQDRLSAQELGDIHIRDRVIKKYEDLKPEAVFLILNGDFVGDRKKPIKGQIKSSYHKFVLPVEDEFKAIIERQEKNGEKKLQFRKIITPGNHDVDRELGRAEYLGKNKIKYSSLAIQEFYDSVDDLNKGKNIEDRFFTPKDCTLRVTLKKYEVLFWILDSAYLCGSIKSLTEDEGEVLFQKNFPKEFLEEKEVDYFLEVANRYDPITVSQETIERCKKEIALCRKDLKQIRIVVVHHSPINPTRRPDKYLFTNDVDFLNVLCDCNFKMLLHGHHHESTVLHFEYLSKLEGVTGLANLNKVEFIAPHIESGLTTVGSRAIWSGPAEPKGYNTITISEQKESSLLKVDVDDFALKASDAAGTRRQIPGSNRIRFTQTSRSIADFPDPELRMECLHRMHSKIYSDTPLTEFDKEASISNEVINHIRSEKRFYQNAEKIYASYTTAVMSPGDWIKAGFRDVFNPYFAMSLVRAAQHSGKVKKSMTDLEERYGYVLPSFQFSSWLCDAIISCCNKGREIDAYSIFKKIRKVPNLFSVEEKEFFNRTTQRIEKLSIEKGDVLNGSSCSYWALNYSNEKKRFFEPVDLDFEQFCLGDDSFDDSLIDLVMEFPRVVIWNDEDLLRPSAIDVIRFHEENGVPLFHIHPEQLKNSDGSGVRGQIGQSSLFSRDENGRVKHNRFHNSKSGRSATSSEFLDGGYASDEDYRMKIWGVDSHEDGYKLKSPEAIKSDFPVSEFKYLAHHPKTLFACDAWLIAASRKFKLV